MQPNILWKNMYLIKQTEPEDGRFLYLKKLVFCIQNSQALIWIDGPHCNRICAE